MGVLCVIQDMIISVSQPFERINMSNHRLHCVAQPSAVKRCYSNILSSACRWSIRYKACLSVHMIEVEPSPGLWLITA